MIYVVFWILTTIVTVPCNEPQEDPYRPGYSIPSFYTDYCYQTTRDTFIRWFTEKEVARLFVEQAGDRSDVEKIWLDSTIIPEPEVYFKWELDSTILITLDTTWLISYDTDTSLEWIQIYFDTISLYDSLDVKPIKDE